jgi:hypothetical protein
MSSILFCFVLCVSISHGLVVTYPDNLIKTYDTPTIPHSHPSWDPFEAELVAVLPQDACDEESIQNGDMLADKVILISACTFFVFRY